MGVDHKLKLFVLLGLFLSACSSKTSFLQRQWINLDCYQDETPLVLDFRDKKQVLSYDVQFQSRNWQYTYRTGHLLLQEPNQTLPQSFQIQFLSKDSLVLLPKNTPQTPVIYVSSEQQFRSQKAFRKYLRAWEGRSLGIEKTLFSLLEPLQAETVEQRVLNLTDAIQEGEYLTTPTIFLLMNLKPEKQSEERPDATEQRRLVSKIWRITKNKGIFRLELENQQDIETTLPIYQSKDKDAKPQTVLDLRISANAHAKIEPLPNGGLKIDIEGVRVGKGWLRVGLPPFILKGNKGEIFGFEFSVLR